MLLGSLVVGLALGLLAGGKLENLASVRLRLVQLLFLGLFLRYATQFAIEGGLEPADTYRLPLFAAGFVVLLAGLWINRDQAGFALAFVGVLLNAAAIVTNGGFMPVWEPSIVAAGLTPADVGTAFHKIVGFAADGGVPRDFLAQAGPLGDIIPLPIPFFNNVASIGDLFLAAGLAFFLFATTVRDPHEVEAARSAALARRLGELGAIPDWATGLVGAEEVAGIRAQENAVAAAAAATVHRGGLVRAASLERAIQLGGSTVGSEGLVPRARRLPFPGVPPILERVRRHPYVRLALDSSFSALWTGQLVSALGDRIHQVALAFVVYEATDSAIAVGAVFLVATVPNLLFSPIAGTLVDRWDVREVMIVSDLLRAGIVLLIPLAVVTNLALAYPLVFLVTTVSIFFRPAKGAILPRIVHSDDLVPANSALWVGETFADIGGYVIAGLFVGLLADQLPLAFWVDSVTYIASAILIASIAVAPLKRSAEELADVARAKAAGVRGAIAAFREELGEGWRFLRGERVLLANTLQATVGQFMLGIILVLTPVLTKTAIDHEGIGDREAYAFLEGAIGAGNLVGGFIIGLIGSRLSLGRMVILGYVVTGALVALFPLSGSMSLALGVAFGVGVGNLAFVIQVDDPVQVRVSGGVVQQPELAFGLDRRLAADFDVLLHREEVESRRGLPDCLRSAGHAQRSHDCETHEQCGRSENGSGHGAAFFLSIECGLSTRQAVIAIVSLTAHNDLATQGIDYQPGRCVRGSAAGCVMRCMMHAPKVFACWLLLVPASAVAQSATPPSAGFSERLGYLLAQASSGFALLRGDSIGVDTWRGRFLLTTDLDSATAVSASSISVLARQHADGRPGKTIVAVFPVALVGPQADSVSFSRLEEQVSAVLPSWQKRQPGNWSECADPRRGKEVLLFRTRTATGAGLLSLSITLHPDTACD